MVVARLVAEVALRPEVLVGLERRLEEVEGCPLEGQVEAEALSVGREALELVVLEEPGQVRQLMVEPQEEPEVAVQALAISAVTA